MPTKDGIGIIAGTLLAFLVSGGVWYWSPSTPALVMTCLLGFLAVFNFYFFRDPQREITGNHLSVLSPADGKVTQIVKIHEPDYFNSQVQRISIFLSVFNVHVNRAPISGTVDHFVYHTGKFMAAFKEKASLENEQTAIGVRNDFGHRVLFKQIAGLIARRIVCHLREGDTCKAGQRIGMIRYGSRVDVFLTPDAKVLVTKGQKVKAGETVLATFPNKGSESSSEERLVEVPQSELSN